MTLKVLDLFSGIGGFSLGLKRTGGFQTVGYCEIDPYCQQVLLARMHDGNLDSAPICPDVRALDGGPWYGCVDLICGGFPCQDISIAGKKTGIDGERSGLYKEIVRLVRQVRPAYVLMENSPNLLAGGLGRVLGELASSGYDAEWDVIPACAVGARHIRERIWILAYPNGEGELQPQRGVQDERGRSSYRGEEVPDTLQEWERWEQWQGTPQGHPPRVLRGSISGDWSPEPGMGRVADGIPNRVDRIDGLGNAVVPQVVEWIGRRILEAQKMQKEQR